MRSVLHLMHLGLAVLSASAASQRRRRRERKRERERSYEERALCSTYAWCYIWCIFGCALRQCCKSEEEEREKERERSYEERALCSTCAWCYIRCIFGCALGAVLQVWGGERDCSHEDRALRSVCTQCYIGCILDWLCTQAGLQVGWGGGERDCSHEGRPCARHALSVTFDVSWTGCPLRQCCKCDSIISLAPAPDSSLQLLSRAETPGQCRQWGEQNNIHQAPVGCCPDSFFLQ